MKNILGAIAVYAAILACLWFGYIEGMDGPLNVLRLYLGMNLLVALFEPLRDPAPDKLAEALKGRGDIYLQTITVWWLWLAFCNAWYGAWFASICALCVMVLRVGTLLQWREKLEKLNKEQNETATR